MTVFVWHEDKIGIIQGLPAYEGNNGYRRRNNTYKTIGWEKGRVNYEYKRQNNWHVTENCIGITKNNPRKTGNNGPLRLNFAHMPVNNADARKYYAHIPK